MGRLDEVIKLINLYRVTGQAPDPNLIEELEHLKREEKLRESAMAFAESLTHSPVKTTPVILPPPPPPPAWISDEDPIEWNQLDTRFKKLENWVSKISNAGPGSGETWLKRLDDEKWLAFQAALDQPVSAKPKLKKLLSEPGLLG